MKKILFVLLFALPMFEAFSQTDEMIKKKKGYFNATQIGLLMGNHLIYERPPYHFTYPYYPTYPYIPINSPTITEMQTTPFIAMTNGYMFNEHIAAGIGVGMDIFDFNLFPVFADIRLTLWDHKISPFLGFKTGYSFASAKKKNHEGALFVDYLQGQVIEAYIRNYGGFMLHPEIGVKVPLSEKSDMMFTVAYRYQKTKTVASQTWETTQTWETDYVEREHKSILNRIAIGFAIMFR